MKKFLFLAVFIFLVTAKFLIAPAFSFQDYGLYTHTYLIPTKDPSCMNLMWQTGTDIHGSWVKWGYSADDLKYSAYVYREHQNIKNEGHPILSAADFVRWDATIWAAPGLHIYAKVYVAEEMDYDNDNAKYSFNNDFVLPLHPSAKHLVFYGYGDTRSCETDFNDVSTALWKSEVANPVNNKTFLLHAGDVVYNGGETWIDYRANYWMDYFSKHTKAKDVLLDLPVFVALGNHDFNWETVGDYPKYFYTNFPYPQYRDSIEYIPHLNDDGELYGNLDEAYYSFDYGPVHVAVLDTYTDGELDNLGGCHIGSGLEKDKKQYNWLKDDLAATKKDWKIVMMHVSPLSCSCGISTQVKCDLEELFQDKAVDLVISAHDHYYARGQYEWGSATNPNEDCGGEYHKGITHMVLGGAGPA